MRTFRVFFFFFFFAVVVVVVVTHCRVYIQVDWTEINAAWGQTALLLQKMAEKMNFTFRR